MRKSFILLLGTILLCFQVMSQTRTVTGKVTDDKNKPIANVSVQVKGMDVGTTTRDDGSFSLAVPSNARSLVFTSVNTESKEVFLGKQSSFNVRLELSSAEMK